MEKTALNKATRLMQEGKLSQGARNILYEAAQKDRLARSNSLRSINLHDKINSKGIAEATANMPKVRTLKNYKAMERSHMTKSSDALGQFRRLKNEGKRNAEVVSVAKKTLEELGGSFKGVKLDKRMPPYGAKLENDENFPKMTIRLPAKRAKAKYKGNFSDLSKKFLDKGERGQRAFHEINSELKDAVRGEKLLRKKGYKPGTKEYAMGKFGLRYNLGVSSHGSANVFLNDQKHLDRMGNPDLKEFYDRVRSLKDVRNPMIIGTKNKLKPKTELSVIEDMRKHYNARRTGIKDIKAHLTNYTKGNTKTNPKVSEEFAATPFFEPKGNKKNGGLKYNDIRYDY